MPIYEYQCRNCDHYLEALQKLSDPLLTDCPECGRPALRRLISAPNFRLKGSGWYETDFKSGNRRNIAGGGDAAEQGDKPKGKDEAGKEKTGKEKTDKNAAGKDGAGKDKAAQPGRKRVASGERGRAARKSERARKGRGDDTSA